MKNAIKFGLLLAVIAGLAAGFSSCDNVLALGDRLNLDGPRLDLEMPKSRQPVDGMFYMRGTVTSNNSLDRMQVRAEYNKNDVIARFGVEWRYTHSTGAWEYTLDGGASWAPVQALTLYEYDEVLDAFVAVSYSPQYSGTDRSGSWVLPINMDLIFPDPRDPLVDKHDDGQYLFTVTAWDIAGNSDDNSYKNRTVILDTTNPYVQILAPRLNKESDPEQNAQLLDLQGVADWRDPKYLGQFMNGRFNLQYLIKAENDVWSLDIRFYEESVDWELDPENYVYRINKNEAADRPAVPNPGDTVRPFGRLSVMDLNKTAAGTTSYDGNATHYLKTPVGTGQTTLRIVATCMSASGLEMELPEEKDQGCFVYWPDSDIPWLNFTPALDDTDTGSGAYPNWGVEFFPNSVIACKAYDDDGLGSIYYEIYEVDSITGAILAVQPEGFPIKETIVANGSRVFSWEFSPPSFSSSFKIEATVYERDKSPEMTLEAVKYGYFEVRDVTFPEIVPPDTPKSNSPLFEFIEVDNDNGDWYIDIRGRALADSGIDSIYLVWINPHSMNYAAMSQLALFRDPTWEGKFWVPGNPVNDPSDPSVWPAYNDALPLNNIYGWGSRNPLTGNPPEKGFLTDPGIDRAFDMDNPNKIWNIDFVDAGLDLETGRKQVEYSRRVYLKKDLNIAPEDLTYDSPYDFLKSQVFVFKATDANPTEPKSTMLIWAPQGDTEAPRVTITDVYITRAGQTFNEANDRLTFRDWNELDPFNPGDRVTVRGDWTEDSGMGSGLQPDLDILQDVLKNRLIIKIGVRELNNVKHTSKVIVTDNGLAKDIRGTWEATADVGSDDTYELIAAGLKDTLVVTSNFTDLGGNISEDGYSWLIRSDKLRFVRVGSEHDDGVFSTNYYYPDPASDKYTLHGDPVKIDIFLEFNKPVLLKNTSNPPVLLLNNGGIATYDWTNRTQYSGTYPGGTQILNSRQHFIYEVLPGQNTTDLTGVLNLSGLQGGETGYDDPGWEDNYRYVWIDRTGAETVRVTMTQQDLDEGLGKLPVVDTVGQDGYNFTLKAGKTIEIDTTPPVLDSIRPNIKPGWYNGGNVLYITAKFEESVQIGSGTGLPRLVTNMKNDYNSVNKIDLAIPPPVAPDNWPASNPAYNELNYIWVSNDSVIFSFPITLGDTIENFADLVITSLAAGSEIRDLAGNLYVPPGGDFPETMTGIKVHAMAAPTPKVLVSSDSSGATVIGSSNYVWDDVLYIWNEELDAEGNNRSSSWNPDSYTSIENFLESDDDDPTGFAKVRLKSVYVDGLYVAIEPEGDIGVPGYDWTLEYSVDYGRNWTRTSGAPTLQKGLGNYAITARQIDPAGNASEWTTPITLYWDQGALLTRISSTKPNGTYTNNSNIVVAPQTPREDIIPITLTFRRKVKFVTNPTFTLSVMDYKDYDEWDGTGTRPTPVTVTATPSDWDDILLYPDGAFSYTFYYEVQNFDSTQGVRLNVDNITGLGVMDVLDEYDTPVGSMVNIADVSGNNLSKNKEIYIAYGRPVRVSGPSFTSLSPGADGSSYETVMEVEFDRNIWTNGSQTIKIQQKQEGYRLPAVVSEAQAIRYRAILADAGFTFKDYYTPGVNGWTSDGTAYGGASDSVIKYILNFDIDPYEIEPNPASTKTAPLDDYEKFAEAMRTAEAIAVSMSSSAVKVPEDTNGDHMTLEVTLKGSNALTVLGAEFEVVYSNGMVRDQFTNPCEGFNSTTDGGDQIKTPGIDRPYIRVDKRPETINRAAGGANQPTFEVNWTGTTSVRLDCRTPYSQVKWNAVMNQDVWNPTSGTPTADATTIGWTYVSNANQNWPPVFGYHADGSSRPGGGTNQNSTGGSNIRNPGTPADPETTSANQSASTTADYTASGTYGTTNGTASTPVTIGTGNTTSTTWGNLYHGFRWRVRAKGMVGSDLSSQYAEEIAYRSVFTFTGRSINSAGSGQTFTAGDQLWIRGGNTMSGTNIPGFPLTTADNWDDLYDKGERAGIRLMKKTAGSSLAESTWQWVTWEMNAQAYVTLFLGRDKDDQGNELNTPADVVMQYGPKRSAFQDGEWTLLKEFYSIFPGSHRFIISNRPQFYGQGSARVNEFNFNKAFYERPDMTATWPAP